VVRLEVRKRDVRAEGRNLLLRVAGRGVGDGADAVGSDRRRSGLLRPYQLLVGRGSRRTLPASSGMSSGGAWLGLGSRPDLLPGTRSRGWASSREFSVGEGDE
jgi:hypothetical protein